MKATEMIKELQAIVDVEDDLDVDVSVEKQIETTDQQYLVADARFVILEPYPKGKRISIRDWPY